MAKVSTYLNFPGTAEAAFNFYRGVFGTNFKRDIARFGDMPPEAGQVPLSAAEKNLILHIELPILGDHVIMGTDVVPSMGFTVRPGNHVYINLETDTLAQSEALYQALSAGGVVETPLQKMFWGEYFASFSDRFGINWMINCPI